MFSQNRELPAESINLPAEHLVDGDQWLRFNVGGAMLETSRATIDKLHSTFFSQLLDERFDDDKPLNNVYRIDRDAQILQVFLNYGRYGRVVAVPDHIGEGLLLYEHKFYGMGKAVADAIKAHFVEKSKGPTSIQLERVEITELAMDKRYLHHNVYGLMSGTQMLCFTKVPGKGICYRDVGSLFVYERPHDKYPALFRAICYRCNHRVCLADDALVGLEGWCHKCALCLRCQDILCEDNRRGPDANRQDVETDRNGHRFVRKTASAVFVSTEVAAIRPLDSSEDDDSTDETDAEEGMDLRAVIKDPVSEMIMRNNKKGVAGMGARKFSLLPPAEKPPKIKEASGKLKLPQLPNTLAPKVTKGVGSRKLERRHTEPAAFDIEQFAQFLHGGKW